MSKFADMMRAIEAAAERKGPTAVEELNAFAEHFRRAAKKFRSGEGYAVRAARTKRVRREMLDETMAQDFAALIRAGETTATARVRLNLGAVRAKRIRAVAVRMKLLKPREQG